MVSSWAMKQSWAFYSPAIYNGLVIFSFSSYTLWNNDEKDSSGLRVGSRHHCRFTDSAVHQVQHVEGHRTKCFNMKYISPSFNPQICKQKWEDEGLDNLIKIDGLVFLFLFYFYFFVGRLMEIPAGFIHTSAWGFSLFLAGDVKLWHLLAPPLANDCIFLYITL